MKARIFHSYSKYYNLFYEKKDYSKETQYIIQIITKHHVTGNTILDLGCGTGRHACLLADRGYHVYGIDASETMLSVAQRALRDMPVESQRRLAFSLGDIRDVSLGREFDIVISLFDVMSYQTTNKDLKGALGTVRRHLRNGGMVIFDCWYGPAVLNVRPTIRIKRLRKNGIEIIRIAEPVLDFNNNTVEVKYRILAHDRRRGEVESIEERHKMRYLFKPEIELLFEETGLELIGCEEWLTGRDLGVNTWHACFYGVK